MTENNQNNRQNVLRSRYLIVLVGDKCWQEQQLTNYLAHAQPSSDFQTIDVAYYGKNNRFSAQHKHLLPLSSVNYKHYLGREFAGFIYHHDDLNPDLFAAIAGTIISGGVLLLCLPQLVEKNAKVDNYQTHSFYHQRFYQQLKQDQNVIWFTQQQAQAEDMTLTQCIDNTLALKNNLTTLENSTLSLEADQQYAYHCITDDQQQAVSAIIKVALGRRKRPLTLIADRGRGKSAALALACLELFNQPLAQNIVITAPSLTALTSFYHIIQTYLPTANITKGQVTFQQHNIRFLPLDQLIERPPPHNLLLVDEAASLPLYLLEKLLANNARIVFSSTLHGYEGAGRGFAIKHQALHEKYRLPLNLMSMSTPVRWPVNDCLEGFVFTACLLNAGLANLADDFVKAKNEWLAGFTYQLYTPAQLIADEHLLTAVFSVLVTAHYQTTPSDLKLMLDNPNILIRAFCYQEEIIAVALIIQEGQISAEVVAQITEGQRRLKDQFTPQTLLVHCGVTNAFDYRYWRIMRIAVHPRLQRSGIGGYLLTQIEQEALTQQVDILATSFGLNIDLYRFWLSDKWQLVRIGFTQDHCSGEHSALFLKPLNERSHILVNTQYEHFYQSFVFLLAEQYKKLNTQLTTLILAQMPMNTLPSLTSYDLHCVKSYVNHSMLFDQAAFSLHKWWLHAVKQAVNMNDRETNFAILTARLLQKHSREEVIQTYQLTGKKHLESFLTERISFLLTD